DGQQQPIVLREHDGQYVVVFGHRRLEAIVQLRMEGHSIPVKAIVAEGLDEDTAFRIALRENVQRADFTAMEMAHNITTVRDRFKWKGAGKTGQVADFLGVSPATVSQYEKLLTLPAQVQADVQGGRLSATAALELGSVEAEKQPEVMAKAQEKADRDEAKKAAKVTVKEGATPAEM